MADIKERPIIFSTEMIRQILAGNKTMTRRIVKPMKSQTWLKPETLLKSPSAYPCLIDGEQWAQFRHPLAGQFAHGVQHSEDSPLTCIKCPFGTIGDLLWFKESFYAYGKYRFTGELTESGKKEVEFWDCTLDANGSYRYVADETLPKPSDRFEFGWHKRPSIFMPRIASRFNAPIVNIRIERLQEISDEDAQKEGAKFFDFGRTCFHNPTCKVLEPEYHAQQNGWSMVSAEFAAECLATPRNAFANLWNKINGADSWNQNVWCWVIEFERIKVSK